MLNENIVQGAENAISDRHRTKLTTTERVGNQKARALGDVKNILHSHSSTLSSSKGKKSSMFVANTPMKSTVPIFTEDSSFKTCYVEVKNQPVNTDSDMCETHNHALCEKSLDSFFGDELLKHRLTKEEIDFFGESRNLFQLKSPMLNFTPFELDVSCIEIQEENYQDDRFSDDILDDLIPFSVPDPVPFV